MICTHVLEVAASGLTSPLDAEMSSRRASANGRKQPSHGQIEIGAESRRQGRDVISNMVEVHCVPPTGSRDGNIAFIVVDEDRSCSVHLRIGKALSNGARDDFVQPCAAEMTMGPSNSSSRFAAIKR